MINGVTVVVTTVFDEVTKPLSVHYYFHTVRPTKSEKVLKLKNIKKDGYTSFQHQEQYDHVGPEVTRSQEGQRSQDDVRDYLHLVFRADDNTSNITPCRLPMELSPGSFLLPFNNNSHNLYATATLDAKDNIMPQRIYEYLGLDKLRDTSTFENTIGTNEPLGTVNILVKFGELEFPCNFIIKMAEDAIILGRPFLESTRAQIDVFNEEISFEIGSKKFKFNIDSYQSIEKIYMVDIGQEEETFNPLEIGIDLFSYESPACLEQRTRSYGTPNPQDEIAEPISFSLDRRGLVKRWHVCKPVHVTYDDGNGKDCGMWPTCDPDSKLCFGYNEVFGSIDDTTRERSYDVNEEYAREISNPYSRRFNEYNRVFDNEIEHLLNEYILRIGKKGYVLDDVWEKCQQNYKKTNEAWHDEGYEEDEMWRSGDEKTDYDPPYVNVKTFEVKKYSFKGGRSFICITDREDEALPLGRVNGARFKAMIRKELEGNKYVHEVT
ncbi:phospholipase-like protein [Tanacetum coccineum]|uniref:Phospholipase-like protein n=1 Tax=Tanacetum coccineum TaxID=301880 RepID=A0ABQ5B8Q2_9ASTR